MRIVEVVGDYILDNLPQYVGGENFFLDYLPRDLHKGIVLRLLNSSVNSMGKIRQANLVIYYITDSPAEADKEVEILRKLLMKHRGIGDSKWSVLGYVDIENESYDVNHKKVVSLRFQVGYLED
jgi:hypothetical protein